MIKGFFGENRWLSNFWIAPFIYRDQVYPSVEHFYQAHKALDPFEHDLIRKADTPAEAKRLGRAVVNIDTHYFPSLRRMLMKIGVEQKFIQNQDLKQLLLDTGDQYLEETNTWGDTYWGVCNGKGSNHLGYMLMDIRTEIRHDRLWDGFKV